MMSWSPAVGLSPPAFPGQYFVGGAVDRDVLKLGTSFPTGTGADVEFSTGRWKPVGGIPACI